MQTKVRCPICHFSHYGKANVPCETCRATGRELLAPILPGEAGEEAPAPPRRPPRAHAEPPIGQAVRVTRSLPPPVEEAPAALPDPEPDLVPGVEIAHCNTFHAVDQVPFACPACETVVLSEAVPTHEQEPAFTAQATTHLATLEQLVGTYKQLTHALQTQLDDRNACLARLKRQVGLLTAYLAVEAEDDHG